MARIRTIKPEFWTDDALTECSVSARLLFIGTWNFADDNGNLERSAKQLKMKIFPADDVQIEPLVEELINSNLLVEYRVGGKKYLHIRTFKGHQVISRPSKTSLPPYDDSLRTHGALTEDSVTEGKGREGNRKGKETTTVREAAELLQTYAGVNVTNGGQVVVLQDLIKRFSFEAIEEAFQAAAAAGVETRAFLNWSKSRLERKRGSPQEESFGDFLDDLAAKTKAGGTA